MRLGEPDQRSRHVVSGRLVIRAAELFEEGTVVREQVTTPASQTVAVDDVHAEEITLRAACHPRRPPDQVIPAGRARQGDEHSLACFPRTADAIGRHVALE